MAARIPECYDPVRQAERREEHWDDYVAVLPVCTLCRRRLYPGTKFHTAHYQIVCTRCKDELDENIETVEVDI